MVDDQQIRAARKLTAIVNEFQKLNVEMQAQQMAIFLMVMQKPEITMLEIQKATGLASSSISRNVAAMGKTHRKGIPGLDIIEAYEDPEDRRFKRVRITPKGRRIITSLIRMAE